MEVDEECMLVPAPPDIKCRDGLTVERIRQLACAKGTLRTQYAASTVLCAAAKRVESGLS